MGSGNKVEFFVAVCALVSSLAAVYIAWDQGRVMRAQQHGAVYPVLQVDGYAANDGRVGRLGIRVQNSGAGPALIESVQLRIAGAPTEGLGPYLATMPIGYELSWQALTGRALAAGDSVTPLDIAWPMDVFGPDLVQRVTADAETWVFEICYCSVFDRCWTTRSIGQSRANRVESCPRSERDVFEALGRENVRLMMQRSEGLASPAKDGL
ncbi:MAG: hypothetical protein AAF829_05095 [Pseudomonadota bacterium]